MNLTGAERISLARQVNEKFHNACVKLDKLEYRLEKDEKSVGVYYDNIMLQLFKDYELALWHLRMKN